MISFLGIGSNLGNREEFIASAIEHLAQDPETEILQKSKLLKTKPYGNIDQPYFLNCVVKIETTSSPNQLLKCCMKIENELGRIRKEKWGPRNIDIDILFYDDRILNKPDLIIPHPDLHNRQFLLESLNEIAPDLIHPVLKKKIRKLLQELQ